MVVVVVGVDVVDTLVVVVVVVVDTVRLVVYQCYLVIVVQFVENHIVDFEMVTMDLNN